MMDKYNTALGVLSLAVLLGASPLASQEEEADTVFVGTVERTYLVFGDERGAVSDSGMDATHIPVVWKQEFWLPDPANARDERTERVLPGTSAEGAYAAWERAREDIYAEWAWATDPANLQPEVRPLFCAAADHVRLHPAEGMSLEERDRIADALEAPWGIRQERRLREVFTPETARGGGSARAGETARPGETTRRIAEVVKELGLQPWKAPEPLDPIERDEIDLVVWMGIVSEEDS